MGTLGEQGNAAVHLAFLLWLVISIGVADAVLEWSGYQVQRPPARWHHSSALDSTTGAVYVVGGVAAGLYGIGNEICLADTWELSPDGSEWRELAPAGSSAALPPHTGAALVHMSSPVPLLVLIGGNFMYPCSDETEGEEGMTTVWMHTLGDNRWKAGTAFADSEHGFPASRFVASVASVPTTSGAVRAVLAGGLSAKDGSMLGDVWELDMTRSFTSDTRGVWRMLGELPRLSAQAAAMYHPPSGTVYLHGGFMASNDGQASGESTASLAVTDQLLQLSIPAQGAAQNVSVAERTGSGVARRGHTSWLAAIDGQNYLAVAGGLEPDSTAPALQLFDLDSGAWRPSTDSDGDDGESSASSRHAPPGVLRGATAVASRDSRWALILGGYKTVSAPSEGELLADSIDYRFYSEGSEPRWVQLDFTTPPPRVQGSAVMLGADVMLLQGGCTPYCDTASSSTFLSDVWTLRRPSSGDWRGLSAPGALNHWGRVHLAGLGSGSSSPGMRFYHSLVAEAAPGRGAILFGGLIPRPPLNPTFNYDVWRLDVVDDDDGVDSTGTWSRVPITGVGSSIPTSQLLINHPPVFAHTANMDSDGNMIVFGGYDGYLIQHTASHSCTLTSSIWRLKLNGSSGGARWERLSASSSSDPGVPAPRRHHACAFLPRGSPTRGPILWCHGGLSCAGSVLADTWGFDTSAARWSPPQHATSPGARAAASLVPVSDTQLILTGGFASVETQAAVAGVWVLDAGCQPALARWREIFPASLHFRMHHSGVHLGGGVVAMVGGEVADNDGDDDGWTLATSWTAGEALHVTNSLELLDASECNLQSGEETCPATLGLCDSAPFTASLSVVVTLPLPTDPTSSAADPTCVMSTDGVDVVVSEVGSGSVLRTCMSPADSGGAESEAGCDWSASSSGSDSALVIRGIALREASANVSVRAVYNGVVLAESAPLELSGGEDAPEQSALSLRLTAPAVLTFWLRAGNEPLPGAAVELMRCVSEDFCLPVELPADLPPACVPTTTNEFGGAEFPVWPPLTETAYGFRVRVTVDGISYWSRRIAPQSLHPGKVWGESLAIPSGITASAEVLLMLSGISGLDSTTQGIWPDVELRLLQRTTSDVVTTGTVGLQRLSTTAYDSLISSPHNSWPSVWQEGELDIDLQSEYVLHAVAEGTDGRYLLAQSTQTLSGTSTRHTLSFQVEIQYMLLKLTLVFPSCLERSVDCSREIRTIPSAVARVTTGLVTVRDADLTAPMYDAAPADPPRRALAQLNHGSFEWTHSGRSDAAGELRLGLFFSNALPEGAPQLKLQLSYGAQAIHPPITIQRRPEVNLGTVIATSPLLCVGQTISAMAGAFPVSDLMQLADPRPAVPPGHVCRYNIRPPWPSGTAGTLEIHVYHHLMSDDDELVLMPTNSQGSVLFSITCARRGCGNENTSPYHLQVRASRMDILFQAGQAGPKAEQDVTGFMVKFAASSSSMLPSEDPSLGSGGSNNNLDGVSNRVLIEVMTAGVVSIVLLLLVVCCVWKLCWMRMRHNQMAEGALLERRSGEETFLELIGINGGTRRRNGWDSAQRGGGHADHWHQHATGEPVVRQQRRRRGVPSSVVAQLPMHKHVTEPTPEGEEAEEPDCCSICLEDYEDGMMLKVLPCTHKFHSDCIKAWLHRNTTCPLCKYVLYEPPHVEVVELMPNALTGPPTPAESPEIPPARLVGAVNRDESEEGVDIRASDRVVGGDRPRSQPSSLSGRVGSY